MIIYNQRQRLRKQGHKLPHARAHNGGKRVRRQVCTPDPP